MTQYSNFKKPVSSFRTAMSYQPAETQNSDETNNKNITNKTIQTYKDNLNTILKKYGLENRFDIISTIIGEELTDDKLSLMQDEDIEHITECLEKAFKECRDPKTKKIDLENGIAKARNYFLLAQNGCDIDNNTEEEPADINGILKKVLCNKENLESLSETEKQDAIKKYFEDKLNEYQKQGKTNPEEELEKDFTKLLIVLPDKEKKLLLKVVLEVFKTTSVVGKFFESLKNNELRMELADSVTYEQYKSLGKQQQKEITKYMSAPGTEKLVCQLEQEAQDYYLKNKDVLEQIYKKDESQLTDEERVIKSEYEKLAKIIGNTHEGMLRNANLSDENKQKLTERIIDIFKGTPYQERYIQNLAESLSKSELAAKYKDILDKATENKFSEELSKVNEKSATDDSGKFKTVPEEVIAKSEEKILAIKQSMEEASVPKPNVVEIKKSHSETDNYSETSVVNYETITCDNGNDIIKDIFTGKIKVSEYLEHVAIKKYKLLNTAIQGNILLNATGEFFNDLVQNLETSTFEHLLSIGWKGRSYDATQKVKDELEERKNDVA